MHGKYGDREAVGQAVALVEDIGCRRRRREAGAERKRRDSHRPAPPAGHATRQHYDTALLRFERGNTAGPGGVVVPMPAPPLTAEGLRADDMNADGAPKPHVTEPTKAEIVEAAPDAQESEKPCVRRWPHYGVDGWMIGKLFYACDADGWISHTPTADAACPIPANVAAEVKFRDGDVHESLPNEAWRWNHEGLAGDIVAWRPVTQA